MTSLVDPTTAADRVPIIDALLRFGAGTDMGDVAMLGSAFADDVLVDFSACGRTIGLDVDPLHGKNAVVGFLAGTSARQRTSHVVSNARVRVDGDRAELRALVDATHVVRDDQRTRFRMMNWYAVDLVAGEGSWRIVGMAIENIWFDGDPAVLFVR